MKFLNVLRDGHALRVPPRSLTDPVAGIDGTGTLRTEVRPPGPAARTGSHC